VTPYEILYHRGSNYLLRSLHILCLTASFGAPALIAQDESSAQSGDNGEEKSAITIETLPLEELRIFTQIYSGIRSSYIEEIDDKTLLTHAIRGMLSQLDPHSTYLDGSSYTDLQIQTRGEFGGLGIDVDMEDGYVKVVSPIDDTPAMRAGIEAGDLIIKLDGKTVKGLNLNQAIEKMRGEVGTDIVLTIVRQHVKKPFGLTLTRDSIKVSKVRSGVRDEHYGYIRIAQFQVPTGPDVKDAYDKLLEASPDLKGLVIDLRNNPGGVLKAAVDVVDLFLDEGLVVYTEGRLKDASKKHMAAPGDISNGLPIIVLINGGSASASEIVAGALQDHGRALVMGTLSFGKGSVQNVISIGDERAVKITTALYYTPDGRSIQAQGIKPDIVVERVKVTSVQSRAYITEADLSGHLKNTNGGEELDSNARKSADTDKYNKDSQLYEALTLLKGLSLFNTNLQQKQQSAKAEQNETVKITQEKDDIVQDSEADQD
jgi:carboxyl-terminal processing protease